MAANTFRGWKKQDDMRKKMQSTGKGLPGVEEGTKNCGIDCGYKAICRPSQSSIVERMRAAVVVARATACGGNI
jgi:hypothetical protein